MIPLTAATSWLLLIALCALGVTFAVLLARHLEAVDDQKSIDQWRRTCLAILDKPDVLFDQMLDKVLREQGRDDLADELYDREDERD